MKAFRVTVKAATALGALTALGVAHGQPSAALQPPQPAHILKASAKLLKDNFFRAFSVIDPITLEQPPADQAQYLLSTQSFAPHASEGVQWSAQAVDAERVTLCLKILARHKGPWRALVQQGLRLGWTPADEGCAAARAKLPPSLPVTQAFILTLDRRDVPQSLIAPEEPVLGGAGQTDPSPTTVVLKKRVSKLDLVNATGTDADYVTITITNPAKKPKKWEPLDGLTLSLTALAVRNGFIAQHTCVDVLPGDSCTLQIRYVGTKKGAYTGALIGQFSNGERFRIQLKGSVAKTKK